MHISRSGGTSICDAAWRQGCRPPGERTRASNCWSKAMCDGPKWFQFDETLLNRRNVTTCQDRENQYHEHGFDFASNGDPVCARVGVPPPHPLLKYRQCLTFWLTEHTRKHVCMHACMCTHKYTENYLELPNCNRGRLFRWTQIRDPMTRSVITIFSY